MMHIALITQSLLETKSGWMSQIPTWIIVGVVILVVLFSYLLIVSPIGSNKRRGKRRTILR